ncbi:MAG: DUF4390 domain-containing protein [Burkholderiales bacterium]|jgi:hypothetical protein|nr:DUF4390 domain-containing protein [Burkholderiales bacterium]
MIFFPFSFARFFLCVALGAVWLCLFSFARAETIPYKNAELRIDENVAVFSADYDLVFSAGQQEALTRGIPLYFMLEWKVTYPRWYWFDKTIINDRVPFRVSFLPLLQKYRVSSGLLSQDVASQEDAERLIGRISSRPLFLVDDLEKDARYVFSVRLRFDEEQMPPPFRLNTLRSREWKLTSQWLTLSFAP